MRIAFWGNLNSAESLGAQGYLEVPPQPPARTALTSSETMPGACSELCRSTGYSLVLLWRCYVRAGGREWCLLFGDNVLPYLQLLICLGFF